jgi:hypothetical protein
MSSRAGKPSTSHGGSSAADSAPPSSCRRCSSFFFPLGRGGLAAVLALHWWPLALLPLGFVWSIRSSLPEAVRKERLDQAAAIVALLLARTVLNVAVLSYASIRYRRLVL